MLRRHTNCRIHHHHLQVLHSYACFPAPRIPEEPPDLKHSFIITSTNISCQLSWGVPSSDAPVTGYQVIWGQVLPSSQYLLMDKSTALSKILQKASTSARETAGAKSFTLIFHYFETH